MWAKFDDDAPNHPKFKTAGRQIGRDGAILAWGFYSRGVCFANKHLTDGLLPVDEVASWSPRWETFAVSLVAARLWLEVDGGYLIHDYHDHNPHADEVRTKREQDRIRKENKRREDLGLKPLPCGVRAESGRNPGGHAAESEQSPSSPASACAGAPGCVPSRPVPSRPVRSSPPNPPHEGGVNGNGTQRLTRAERKLAAKLGPTYSDDWYAECHHDPKCETGPMHRQRLGIDALKAEALKPDDEVTEKDLDAAHVGRGS